MSIDVTLSPLQSTYDVSLINDNFERIEAALEDGVSRTGNSPNNMGADLDMDNENLLNVADIYVNGDINYQGEVLVPAEVGSIPLATPTTSGLMSGDDKAIIDDLPYVYPDRASVIAADVPDQFRAIRVKTPNDYILNYAETVSTDLRSAITTNGGTKYWAPSGPFVSPQHYGENTTPGTTDMSDALDAMSAGLAHTPLVGVTYPDFAALYGGAKFETPTTVSFLGERVGVNRPWIMGALDANIDGVFDVGPGAIYGVKLTDGRLVALPTFDASPLATHTHPTEGLVTTVPGYAMVIGTYETTDKKTAQENVFYVDGVTIDNTFEIDCDFMCGGIFLTNTNRTTIDSAHIFNMAKGTMGIRTAVSDQIATANHLGNFNPQTGAPFAASGSQSKNPELRISRVLISGRNRQGGISFPPGETDLTMDTTGIGIYTADFHLDAPIITATTRSVEFDMFRNGQFYNGHPWSNSIIYGPDCGNILTSGGYWDYTDIVMYSFIHQFVNCSWGAGSANLRLVSTTADEDADGLVLVGCRFYNTSTINYGSEAGGTWVATTARKHVITAYSEAEDIPLLQLGDKFRVGNDGLVQISYDGAPSIYMAGSANSDFLMVPYSALGVALINDQFRFDATHAAWRFGRDNNGSSGNGYIQRAPDGTDYLITTDNAGNRVSTAI